MEDFDEAEEMNEEDLLELGDECGSINLKVSLQSLTPQNHIQETLNNFIKNEKGGAEYVLYCVK